MRSQEKLHDPKYRSWTWGGWHFRKILLLHKFCFRIQSLKHKSSKSYTKSFSTSFKYVSRLSIDGFILLRYTCQLMTPTISTYSKKNAVKASVKMKTPQKHDPVGWFKASDIGRGRSWLSSCVTIRMHSSFKELTFFDCKVKILSRLHGMLAITPFDSLKCLIHWQLSMNFGLEIENIWVTTVDDCENSLRNSKCS